MYGGLSLHLGPEDRHHLGGGGNTGASSIHRRADAAPLRGSNACADELLCNAGADNNAHHNSDERLRVDAGTGGERADAEPDRRADRSAGRGDAGADFRRVLVSGTNDRTGSDADGGDRRD